MKAPFILYPRDQECPCNSKLPAGACCFREEPPIACEEVRFKKLDFDVKLSDGQGHTAPLPPNQEFGIVLNVPGQIEKQIDEIANIATRKVEFPDGLSPAQMLDLCHPLSKRIDGLTDAIYSCRYHQLQFIFRLHRIVEQQTSAFEPPQSRHTIRINDRPLSIELESFLIGVISTLDALAGLLVVYFRIASKHNSFEKLRRYLLENHSGEGKPAVRDMLCEANGSWIKGVREIRNAIVHEGSFGAFQGVGHKSMLLLDAELNGVPAGEFAVTTWRLLRELVVRTTEVAPPYRPDFSQGK